MKAYLKNLMENRSHYNIWHGVCMHKEMNPVKGGVQGMKLFWETIGGPAPVKLMNMGNDGAASNGAPGSKAVQHADVEERVCPHGD
jgi:hypothetical protein